MNGQDYEQLTLFQGDSRASLLVQPGSDEARAMTATSGLKCCELSKISGPLGSLVKMLLGSSTWRSTRCYLTWKPLGTPSSRLLFQLAASTPRIEGTEFSSWPTPTVWDKKGFDKHPRKDATSTRSVLLSQKVALFPTPTKFDSTCGDLKGKEYTGGSLHAMKLIQAAKLLPTPNAQNAKANGEIHGEGGQSLDVLVGGRLNPTWVEWLMGFPLGWTDLGASETQ